MDYILLALFSVIGGGILVFVVLHYRIKKVQEQQRKQDAEGVRLQNVVRDINAQSEDLRNQSSRLEAARAEFDAKKISYDELRDESTMLKEDLRNISVMVRKLQLDCDVQRQTQESLYEKIRELGSRYLKENVKWIGTSITPNNFTSCKQRLLEVIQRCRGIGFEISPEEEAGLVANLREEFEKAVRIAFQREEQTRIKAQIREEQAREREIERELRQLDREREAIKTALERALAAARDEHSEEVERLKARLAEAEERSQRAIAQAQLTKAGYVYVISNIGAFGEGVFKIGMTRRLEPQDRIRELGDASVPFPFDVHMMISCEDAPTLENTLHRELHKLRLNKVNPRKEFFKIDIESIRNIVESNHGNVDYVAEPEALEYRQSLTMSDEDEEFIEHVYDQLDDDNMLVEDDV